MPVILDYNSMKVECVPACETDFKKQAKYQILKDAINKINNNNRVITNITWECFETYNKTKHYVYFVTHCYYSSLNDVLTEDSIENFINSFIK